MPHRFLVLRFCKGSKVSANCESSPAVSCESPNGCRHSPSHDLFTAESKFHESSFPPIVSTCLKSNCSRTKATQFAPHQSPRFSSRNLVVFFFRMELRGKQICSDGICCSTDLFRDERAAPKSEKCARDVLTYIILQTKRRGFLLFFSEFGRVSNASKNSTTPREKRSAAQNDNE